MQVVSGRTLDAYGRTGYPGTRVPGYAGGSENSVLRKIVRLCESVFTCKAQRFLPGTGIALEISKMLPGACTGLRSRVGIKGRNSYQKIPLAGRRYTGRFAQKAHLVRGYCEWYWIVLRGEW
eukprot:1194494-Rhodomonas_salina.1